jgi:potassium-dependent mechanosensitive channel
LGFDLTALAIIFGGLSVGIGFGLQDLVANFISGILLLFERTLRPGDIIEVGGNRGTVSQLRMRSTVLRTFDNVEIFVPNKTLLTSSVHNFCHTNRTVRRTVSVGVSYDSDPRQVRDILERITTSHGLIMKDPAPAVLFTGFGDSSLDFDVNFWIEDISNALRVVNDVHFMIFSEFKKAGVEIPFPQRDLHLRTSVPIESQVMQMERAAALQSNGADSPAAPDEDDHADTGDTGNTEAADTRQAQTQDGEKSPSKPSLP